MDKASAIQGQLPSLGPVYDFTDGRALSLHLDRIGFNCDCFTRGSHRQTRVDRSYARSIHDHIVDDRFLEARALDRDAILARGKIGDCVHTTAAGLSGS